MRQDGRIIPWDTWNKLATLDLSGERRTEDLLYARVDNFITDLIDVMPWYQSPYLLLEAGQVPIYYGGKEVHQAPNQLPVVKDELIEDAEALGISITDGWEGTYDHPGKLGSRTFNVWVEIVDGNPSVAFQDVTDSIDHTAEDGDRP